MDVSLSELRALVMDREAWRAGIHGVEKNQTGLSDWTELNWYSIEKFISNVCFLCVKLSQDVTTCNSFLDLTTKMFFIEQNPLLS